MSGIVFTMTKVMLSEAPSQTLLMPTHHFTIAVHASGLEGCGGRGDIWEEEGGGCRVGGALSNVPFCFHHE
ncbi:hypothetical protein RIB2604_01005060 [Aspergillus luchuensis]|uniref:Uncharacterized protein n=1 Tax=Aspergillus kawachii TaxID=1069201 RepID=A0A146F6D4_ASPKA|nr:hypothetical protein RIB2604_01005060 [Aspergillus luchuensis]